MRAREPSSVSTVCEKIVHCDKDMRDIEKCIVGELGGENNRCAFFRTVDYIRLRIAALYLPAKTAQFASYSDLRVVLTPTEQGPLVAVLRRFNECSVGNSDERVLDAMETGSLPQDFILPAQQPCQKRMRTDLPRQSSI
jgi:hypothetical protein